MKRFTKIKNTQQRILDRLSLAAFCIAVAGAFLAPSTFATSPSVTVTSNFAPRLELTSNVSEEETTSPDYNFKATYENIFNATATLITLDENSSEVANTIIWQENFNGVIGEKNTVLNLDDYSGYNNFIIKVDGVNGYGVTTTRSLRIVYNRDSSETIVVPDTGNFFHGSSLSVEEGIIIGVAAFAATAIIVLGILIKHRS